MQKAHDASYNHHWEDLPSIESPIIALQLNRIEQNIDTIDDRVVAFDLSKANQTDMLQAVRSIIYTKATGTFRITFFNGTYVDIDTDLEKLAVNFDYDDNPESAHYQQIIITLEDGTKKYIDVSALITQYEFLASATINPIVGADGTVSFEVINGSITEDKLEPNFLANCRIEVQLAQGYKEDAEAWATGKRQGTDVPDTDPTYENNSEYYAGQASNSASSALQTKGECEEILAEVQAAASNFSFWIDFDTGQLMYDDNNEYNFTVNYTTGNLEWEVVS